MNCERHSNVYQIICVIKKHFGEGYILTTLIILVLDLWNMINDFGIFFHLHQRSIKFTQELETHITYNYYYNHVYMGKKYNG